MVRGRRKEGRKEDMSLISKFLFIYPRKSVTKLPKCYRVLDRSSGAVSLRILNIIFGNVSSNKRVRFIKTNVRGPEK